MEVSTVKNRYQRFVDIVALCIASALCIFQMYSASFGTWSSFLLSAVHWGAIGSYIILRNPTKIKYAGKVIDWLIILGTAYVCFYQIQMQERLVLSAGFYTTQDIIVGIAALLLVLEIGRRSVGKVLPVICILFLLYCYFGNMVPGLLKTTRFTIKRIAVFIYTSSDGLFGQTIYVSAKYIFLFILFGSILELTGAGKWFVDLAYSACGKARGGPAQAAVYSSMLMGTINGSGAANVVTTGTFTIPLMKKIGLKPGTAGAVEAVASSGGQIMPPVMGAVAFLMAEMTGIEYADIAIAALVPALLYYGTLSVSVYLIARRDHIPAADPNEIQPFWKVLKSGWLYAVPLAVLVYLIISGFSVQMSAFYSIWVTLAVGFVMNRKAITVKNLLAAFEGTVKSIAPVAAACILAGVIMGSMSLTGFGLKVSSLIEHLSGGSLFFTLVLAMVASILLGMGLPTSAAYMVLAILVAPALINMGVSKIAAHLFLLYFGALSTITPPVALSVFAASGISGAGVWETGWEAVKLASTGFIIPFIFAFDNSLLLIGSGGQIAAAVVTGFLGCIVLAMSVSGWMIRRLNIPIRLTFLISGIMLVMSGSLIVSLIGLAIAAVIILVIVWQSRKVSS
ncbi:MAG: TRAP transporter permease [Dysosmobacter sp.]|nr:TRAP transporter permease [Dysosmobacter sp.]